MINANPTLSFTQRTAKIAIAALMLIAVAIAIPACSSSDSASATDFSAFGIKGTISGNNVVIDISSVPDNCSKVKAMTVSINASGASISPDPATARDYSSPIDFTITTPDGSKATYKVLIKGIQCGGATTVVQVGGPAATTTEPPSPPLTFEPASCTPSVDSPTTGGLAVNYVSTNAPPYYQIESTCTLADADGLAGGCYFYELTSTSSYNYDTNISTQGASSVTGPTYIAFGETNVFVPNNTYTQENNIYSETTTTRSYGMSYVAKNGQSCTNQPLVNQAVQINYDK